MRERPAVAAALTGNSRLLATYSGQGELQALYWPHIDFGQHVYALLLGLRSGEGPTQWLHEEPWTHAQRYVTDTPVLVTESRLSSLGLAVDVCDFALAEQDVLVRRLTVRNTGDTARPVQVVVYAHARLFESEQYNTVLYDPAVAGLQVYRRETWLALGASLSPVGWQVGRPGRPADAWPQACSGELQGTAINCGDVNGALLYDLGVLGAGEERELTLYLAPGVSRCAATEAVLSARSRCGSDLLDGVVQWWAEWLASGRQVATGSDRLDALYRQSLIMLKLMSDERGGGFIAGPELDPDYKLSGGYAYCWGRDGAYMTTAMDEAGHFAETRGFFLNWAVKAQEANGAWLHRHYVDGTLAPSWGLLQIDEGASILFGAWRHYELSGDRAFAKAFWPAAERGAAFLMAYRDAATGLPDHSIDLWEKRDALHTYSSAAVYAGLRGVAGLAEALGHDAAPYLAAAESVKQAMAEHLWSEAEGRFLRTIGLVGTGPAEAGRKDLATADLPDIALLGVTFPFGVFPVDDPRVASTIAVVEQALAVPGSGAVYRYVGDGYIGG
ncbi:MAG TPA: glycoside hydrolase family 15 protein, partial [Symbiobacteriaceae bacterium]|nr:glycoside hydrolase family 15 protein [Symbiobacteriaceae bacterium]